MVQNFDKSLSNLKNRAVSVFVFSTCESKREHFLATVSG